MVRNNILVYAFTGAETYEIALESIGVHHPK
jgi:hypothetical protein